jgi:hypothetical protein
MSAPPTATVMTKVTTNPPTARRPALFIVRPGAVAPAICMPDCAGRQSREL